MTMKVLAYNTDQPKLVTTSSSGHTRSRPNDSVEFENNDHEEAGTLMINHVALSPRRNAANARIVIFSTDTPCYSCCQPSSPPSEYIGVYYVSNRKLDEATWLKIFMKSGSDIIGALKQLLVATNETSQLQMTMLASFVCDAYCPNGIEIRRMFCKHMPESNRLPSTSGTPKQHILRFHVQSRICDNTTIRRLVNCRMDYAKTPMGTWYRIQLMIYHHQRP